MKYGQCTTRYETRLTQPKLPQGMPYGGAAQPPNKIQSTNYYVRNYQKIMQNKPNFQKSQMNLNTYNKKNYENINDRTLGENKPNQTQFQTRRRFFHSLHNRLPRRGIYPERSRRGTRIDICWSYPAKSGCPAWKNVGTKNLLAIESYRIYLNRLLLLSN